MSRRGPILWNTVLDTTLKETESLPLFIAKVKETILSHVATGFLSFNDFRFDPSYKNKPILPHV